MGTQFLIELIEQSPAWLSAIAQASLKATLILAVAAVVALASRRWSASARHLVWTLAICGSVALPIFSIVLPAWQLYVLPARAAAVESAFAPADDDVALEPVVGGPNTFVTRDTPYVPKIDVPFTWETGLLALWLVGMSLVLARMFLDRLRVWTLREGALAIVDQRRDLAFQVMIRLGVTRRVQLLESSQIGLPMTWGFVSPVVLLPSRSSQWSASALEIALMHELAHVRRLDALTQLMAQLACAIYWFHPLSWLAAGQMRKLREFACDDEVIVEGTRPSDYARGVLAIVQTLERDDRLGNATLGMAQKSQLKERLMAVLSAHCVRARLSRSRALAAMTVALGLVVGLAVVQPASGAEQHSGTRPQLPTDSVDLEDADESINQTERRTRALLQAVARSKLNREDLANTLAKIAHDEHLDTEETRQLYLAAAAPITDDEDLVKVLKALLVGAPTTEQTARGVLLRTRGMRSHDARAEMLEMMHRVQESALVRGPLADDYLEIAAQFAPDEKLARAIRKLLHPKPVSREAVVRSLQLLDRVPDMELRKQVLIEVTDHQAIGREVEVAYRKLVRPFEENERLAAMERLTGAMGGRSQALAVQVTQRAELQDARKLRRFEQEMEKLGQERDRLQAEAERVKRKAIELDRKIKEQEKARPGSAENR